MTKPEAIKLLEIYGKAWENRNPELILTIFTPDATYNDPKEPENQGHAGIRNYWISKVIGEQKDIHFKLLNIWVDETNGGVPRSLPNGQRSLLTQKEICISI